MNKKKGFLGAGLSTVLLVFVMLCLIVFAVLSLTTARADQQMSQKLAERTTAYYAAQSQAYEKVKKIDDILVKQYNEGKEQFAENVWTVLQEVSDLTVSQEDDGQSVVCSFLQPVDDTQQLEVELTIGLPSEEGEACYRITGWQVQPVEEWKADTGLPVMQRE